MKSYLFAIEFKRSTVKTDTEYIIVYENNKADAKERLIADLRRLKVYDENKVTITDRTLE